ncbi:group 3 secretory phospholipase A2-like [Scomber scombrus]|uniref:phospholipase A2 n=1 Tax=Scomber scombrus TaxID=13677 RepID=A0AAV1MTT8_SCOSC
MAGVRSLYLTLWSAHMQLVTCEVNVNPLVIESYSSLCNRSSQEINQSYIHVSMLPALDSSCALNTSAQKVRTRRDEEGEKKTRRKRSWIFPGTLWCGTGSKAVGYEQLGMFESADRCCREHDHCKHIIPSFTVDYGVFNPNLYTVSHCDCDQRFRQCLLEVNDTISSMVGYSFFNILRVPCFELKQQKRCTEMYWWGMCKKANEAPYAVFKKTLSYNSTDGTSKHDTDRNTDMSTSSKRPHVTENPQIILTRKSPEGEHRCRSRDPPRGDTFYRQRIKGKRCKKHRKEGLTNASKRAGEKKRTRKGRSGFCTHKTEVPSQVIANSRPQTASSTINPPLTQTPALQQHLPIKAAKTNKRHKKAPKQSCCCGSRIHVRSDIFRPHCKHCQEQKTTVRPSTSTYRLPVKVTQSKSTESPKQDTVKRLWITATSASSVTTKLKRTSSLHKDGEDPHRHQEPVGKHISHNIHAERNLRENTALHNMTDNQLMCESLKHLDTCKYKIPPLKKKYDLQNTETTTSYHCDCTSRLAAQIESFKKPSCLHSLLVDFVSQYCIKLPKKKKCQSRKSCSGGFTKASDLLEVLKNIEEKDTAGVQNSGIMRKRGIPVFLYKRCLRLEREADIMAQLT